jgi:hypothetical protein
MDDFGIKRHDAYYFEIWLDISMQFDLAQYPEPVAGDPETYETEHREYIVTRDELNEWVVIAKLKADEYRQSARNDLALESLGATYADVSWIMTRDIHTLGTVRDTKYEADEDLMFVYSRLTSMHRFIFEARTEILKGE